MDRLTLGWADHVDPYASGTASRLVGRSSIWASRFVAPSLHSLRRSPILDLPSTLESSARTNGPRTEILTGPA